MLKTAYTAIVSFLLLLIELSARAVSALTWGATTSDTNDASDYAVRGGVLNYRTGEFDDGTDAVGWYEKD